MTELFVNLQIKCLVCSSEPNKGHVVFIAGLLERTSFVCFCCYPISLRNPHHALFGGKPWIPTGKELFVECSFYYTMRKTPKLAKLQAFENLCFMVSVETAGI